jgi:hypothetical protein
MNVCDLQGHLAVGAKAGCCTQANALIQPAKAGNAHQRFRINPERLAGSMRVYGNPNPLGNDLCRNRYFHGCN